MNIKRLLARAPMAGLAVVLAGVFGSAVGLAQIKSYTLPEMVGQADGAVFGEIVASRAFRVDDPVDGPELYFTTLTIEGREVGSDRPLLVDVTYHGGFVSETEGVYNSEAPVADDVAIGNRVVVFYEWSDNMGGSVAGNALLAAHGGLFRTVAGSRHVAVLGRGEGYAIDRNLKLSDLDAAVAKLRKR